MRLMYYCYCPSYRSSIMDCCYCRWVHLAMEESRRCCRLNYIISFYRLVSRMNTEETGRSTPDRAEKTPERNRNKEAGADEHLKIKSKTTTGMKLGICIYLIVLALAVYLIGGYAYREEDI